MWLKKHPDLMLFLSWIVGNVVAVLAYANKDNSDTFWLFFFLAIIIIIGAEAVCLVLKRRSLFNLFYNLVPYVGIFIIMSLENKNLKAQKDNIDKPIEKEVE
jgi:hypothetical protein